MTKKKTKVGVSGKFGPRYGKTVRENVRKIEEKSKKKHKCPRCGKTGLKRKSYGIWECKCGAKFAGGAWVPQTELGRTASRIVAAGVEGKEAIEEIEALEKEDEEAEKGEE